MQESPLPQRRFQISGCIVLPLLVFTLAIGLAGGFVASSFLMGRGLLPFQSNGSCPLAQEECKEFATFWQAWQIASSNYVDTKAVVPQKMTDGAIEGMLDSLGDQGHTRYLPKEVAQEYQESLQGRFEGIGAYIDVKDGQPLIVQPIEGSPAESAGIKPGDLIMKVDGKSVFGVTVEELRTLVRGPRGTTVRLSVIHTGSTSAVDIDVVRDEIKVPSVTWRMLPDGVALIKLSQFSSPSSDEMKQALEEAKQQGMKSLVLDLRNNPGGYVTSLVDIASQFMAADTVVLLEEDRDGKQSPYKTHDGGVALDVPMVVLVNNNTASAAEILAGALRDQGRAKVIGEPTFGTATVLNQYDLNDGGRILLGTSQWLTPKGQEVRGVGIAPDETVTLDAGALPLSPSEASTLTPAQLKETTDKQLHRALELVGEQAKK